MANIRGIQGGQAAPVAITAVEGTLSLPVTIDTSTDIPIEISSIDSSFPGLPVYGGLVRATASFARPDDTTAYAIGDIVSNSTVATTVMTFSNFARVAGGSGYIMGAMLATNAKSVTPGIRVHLFNASNPTLSVDNALHKELYADDSKRIGYFDFGALSTPADTAGSDDSRVVNFDLRIPFVAVSRDIYAVLETRSIFTPVALETFTLVLFGDLN